jgi:hypothetical protein
MQVDATAVVARKFFGGGRASDDGAGANRQKFRYGRALALTFSSHHITRSTVGRQ